MLRVYAALAFAGLAACASPSGDDAATAGSDLTGGTVETRWSASGYLTAGGSMTCGATLIAPNVVVTAAHCVSDDTKSYAFGTGNVGSSPTITVVERHFHLSYHAVAQGTFDTQHLLRNFDIAYLYLAQSVTGVTPAVLPTTDATGAVDAIGYDGATRKSTPATVHFAVEANLLMGDPVLEASPDGDGSLCAETGDSGSPLVLRNESRETVLGIFVGSVTGCVKALEYMDGFESMYGYRDFLVSGIAAASKN